MIDKIFAVIIGAILLVMCLLLAYGCFVSVVTMVSNERIWKFDTVPHYRGPAKLHYGSATPSSPTARQLRQEFEDGNAYARAYNKKNPWLSGWRRALQDAGYRGGKGW